MSRKSERRAELVESFDEFQSVRYWPQLDGLRTVSIFLVLIIHMGDKWWIPYKGALAVVLFFVISGFLITSLLLREEHRNGSVSLRGFYIRRIFRIAPMYFLALGATTVLVLGFGLGIGREGFAQRLPLLATFNGDLAGDGTFVHSWSIGVEEKFYILWPLVAFGLIILRRHRGLLISLLLPAVVIAAYVPVASYFGVYTGIMAGCALALVMHTRRGFAAVSVLATPVIGSAIFLIAVMAFVIDFAMPRHEETGNAHVQFALAVALLFPFILVGNGWLSRFLALKPLVFIGTRTYGIYLFHPLCIDVIGQVIPSGQTEPFPSLVRFVLAAVLSFAVAEVLYRTFERPLIVIGRRLAKGRTDKTTNGVEPSRGVTTDREQAGTGGPS